jgi:hypothetical protein
VCDIETSTKRRRPDLGCFATEEQKIFGFAIEGKQLNGGLIFEIHGYQFED